MYDKGSGCGTIDRPVTSNNCLNPGLNPDVIFRYLLAVDWIEKVKIKKKRPRVAHWLLQHMFRFNIKSEERDDMNVFKIKRNI